MAAISRQSCSAGLRNIESCGWLNVVVQCLANTPPVKDYFLSKVYENDLNKENRMGSENAALTVAFAELLEEMWGSPKTACPRRLKISLGNHYEQFAGNSLHDAFECFSVLFDTLVEDTNRVKVKPFVEFSDQGETETDKEAARKAWDTFTLRTDSPLSDMFFFQIQRKTKCGRDGCFRDCARYDSCPVLTLPVSSNDDRCQDLMDCINDFGSTEQLKEVYCSRCKDFCPAAVTKKVFRAPTVLAIKLERTKFTCETRRKLQTFVKYPVKGLDLTSHVMNWSDEMEKPIYDLHAVICHEGGLSGGLYSCRVLNSCKVLGGEARQWIEYCDSHRTVLQDEKDVVSKHAYVLFYLRRDATSQLFSKLQDGGIQEPEVVEKIRQTLSS